MFDAILCGRFSSSIKKESSSLKYQERRSTIVLSGRFKFLISRILGTEKKENSMKKKESQFNINTALQLGSQIAYQHKKNKNISDYFRVKKHANTKSSDWISVKLFEENNISRKNIRRNLEDFHEFSENSCEISKDINISLESSVPPTFDWGSKRLRRDIIDSGLSVPSSELFIKSNKRSNHKKSPKSSIKNVKGFKRKSQPKNKNIRQSTLYEYLMKKHENSFKENDKMNDLQSSECIVNIENDKTDDLIIATYNNEKFVASNCNKMKNTPKELKCNEITGCLIHSAESYENSPSQMFDHNTIGQSLPYLTMTLDDEIVKTHEDLISSNTFKEKYIEKNALEDNVAVFKKIHEKDIDDELTPSPTRNLCTETAYHLLESVSSPIIADPECQEYLKDVLVNNDQYPIPQDNDINYTATQNIGEILTSQNVYEENTSHHFWENLLSQKTEDSSGNLTNSTEQPSQNIPREDLPIKKKNSQNGSEIFNYILSQDYAASNSLMDNAMKNMNNLSQKFIEKSTSIIDNNKNSNKLLELSLKIYTQIREQSILTKQVLSKVKPYKHFKVIREMENYACVYKIRPVSDEEYDEIPSSNMSTLCSDDISTKSLSESQEKILFGLKKICADNSYLYNGNEDRNWNIERNKCDILGKIKKVFEKVLEDFDSQRSPFLEIPRQTYSDCLFVNGRLEMKPEENLKKIKVKYKNSSSQFKFCSIMYVLAKVLHALETNTKITRRELYYQIKHLISNQGQIDRAVKAVSYMFNVGPWDLNIVAHKGMVFGDLKIVLSYNVIDCNLPGTLIPQDIDEITEIKSSAFFILVVEKESIFYKLLQEDLPNKLVRPFIMITGKGFPDLNTQLFLKKLWMIMNIPIFILTDADPHGVHIMMTYRFGSLANAHLSKQLVIPKAKWLGVYPSEVIKFNANKQILTEAEKGLVQNLLKTPFMTSHEKIKEELTFMFNSGYKAGIEGLIKNNNFLSEFYFPLKFYNEDLI